MDILTEVLVISDSENKSANCSIFDLKVGNMITSFKGGNSARNCLAFIGQDYIISAFKQKPTIKVWLLNNSHHEESKMISPGIISCLAVTNCGSYCIAGIDKSIYIWEVVSGSLLTCLQYHSKVVTCLRITSDGSHFISGSGDGRVLVWLLSEAVGDSELSNNVKPRFAWMDHHGEVTDIYVGGLSIHARVATVSKDMTCRLYELETGLLLVTVHVDYAITAVVMDELEYFLILGSAEGDIYRINLFSADEAELHYNKVNTKCVFKGHSKEITCLSISSSGKYLVSGSEDHECRVWDMTNFSCIRRIPCVGAVTNAFVTLLPPGLSSQDTKYCPKLNVSDFKRQYDKNDRDAHTVMRIQSKKLSLFHIGSIDEDYDTRMLIKSQESIKTFNQCEVTMKDVATINTQMYSFALCDTISEMCMNTDFPVEEEEENSN